MRIVPWDSQKRVVLAVAVAIFLQWVVLMVQLYWVCEKGETGWEGAPFAMCPTRGLYGGVSQIISEYPHIYFFNDPCPSLLLFPHPAECLSGIPLVAMPIWILRTARISSAARFRLVQALICSSTTIIVALANAITFFCSPRWAAFTGALEAGVALGMCNLPIVLPAIALLFGGDAEKYEESRDHGTTTVHRAPSSGVGVELTLEQERAILDRRTDVETGSGEHTYMFPLHKD